MIHSLRFQSMQNHRLLLLPSKIYKKYFFTLRCPIANHRLLPSKIPITRGRGQVSISAGGLDGDGRSGRGGETRWWRRPGTSHVAHRVEEGAATDGGGCPLLREYDWRAIRSSHGKIHVFKIRKVIKRTKCHVKQSVNISNVVLAKSTIEVL